MSFILHAGRKGGLDVPEDVHRTEQPETDGAVERHIHYQIFCDVIIDPARPLTNYKLLDDIMMELERVRATSMEGSFGTRKEHYDLKRVKARTKLTEILYIFFGNHTANVVRLAKRKEQRALMEAA